MISIHPKSIDFGTINANYASKLKTITLTNEGNKITRFSIDCSRVECQVVIDPNKGLLPVMIEIKLSGFAFEYCHVSVKIFQDYKRQDYQHRRRSIEFGTMDQVRGTARGTDNRYGYTTEIITVECLCDKFFRPGGFPRHLRRFEEYANSICEKRM